MREFLQRLLGDIDPAVFRRHLNVRGWAEHESPSKKSYLYTNHYNGHKVEVEIPVRRDFADYARRISEAADILCAFEKVTPYELATMLANPSADRVIFRYVGEEFKDGTIGIDDSIRIRFARKDLLLSVAHSVVEPSLHFPRLSKVEPVEFLQKCRETPDRAGSFVSEVIVPVSSAVGKLDLEEPFARKTTALLARAVSATARSLESGDDARLLDSAKLGVSANFLTALSRLKPPGNRGALDVEFRWASARPNPGSADSTVSLAAPIFEPLEEVARVLRETASAPGYEVSGYVARLQRAPDDVSKPGQVVIATTLDDRPGMAAVHVTLEPKQYDEAVEAHRSAQQVRITGTLVRSGRKLVLENPGGLVVSTGTGEE